MKFFPTLGHLSLENFGAVHKWYPIFWGHFWPPLPPISDFPPIVKAFLHRDSPIFENLPPLPKIGYHLWTTPKHIFYHFGTNPLYKQNMAKNC